MQPTNKLRFVERYIKSDPAPLILRVLQQWWEQSMTINLGWTGDIPVGESKGEWRDVPMENET